MGPISPPMFNNQHGHHLKKIVYTGSPGWDGPPLCDQPQKFLYENLFPAWGGGDMLTPLPCPPLSVPAHPPTLFFQQPF
jgi:hypothetical protein